ncbi:hypothetical protein F53441_11108 [Fusarium austroafricanum]|uniref:Uncharacterized protein n=1 Tax=Fusarium austroafricanum TaxID=2364996 RepID=A0A8H4K6B4_9HYPO|nr:hypothetical protein F53441_11108 [Fusarium austroafricanum]
MVALSLQETSAGGNGHSQRGARRNLEAQLEAEEKKLAEGKKERAEEGLTTDDMEVGTEVMPTKTTKRERPSASGQHSDSTGPHSSECGTENKSTKGTRRERLSPLTLRRGWGGAYIRARKLEANTETKATKTTRGTLEPPRMRLLVLDARDTKPSRRERQRPSESPQKGRAKAHDSPFSKRKKPMSAASKERMAVLETLRKGSPDSETSTTGGEQRVLHAVYKGRKAYKSKPGAEIMFAKAASGGASDVQNGPSAHSANMKRYREDLQQGWARSHDWHKRAETMPTNVRNGSRSGVFEAILKGRVRN